MTQPTIQPPATLGQATLGIDPVCGMKVASARWSSALDGTTYYFCSERCRGKFAAEPAKYLAPGTPAPQAPPHHAAAHRPAVATSGCTCPMHPEVVRDGPGSC